jgi:ABC-type transporter Mla subunit MlaD
MADRLREVKQLLADLETFQTRLQGVTETLTLVQQQEQQATDRLAAGRPALERLVERLQRASPALAGEANWRRKQLEKRVGQGRKLAGGLKRRGSGQVAEKERQIVTWLEASYHDLSGLLPLLQSEARRLDAELRRVVTALPAPSEGQETLIQELRRLLVVDRSAAGPTLPPVAEGDVQRLLHLVELVESRLEDRENLERLLRKLT